jgi:rhodanese-related sulfurtransferase
MPTGSGLSRWGPEVVTDAVPSDLPPSSVSEPLPIDRLELLEVLAWDSIILLDAQAPGWYERERLPGAVRALPEDLDSLEGALPKGRESKIVVYCWDLSCSSSTVTARMLIERGYRCVRCYCAGKRDWIEAGLPVARGSA